MSEESGDTKPPNQNEIVKEEVNLQFHLYILIFLCIFYSSWVVPGIFFFIYLLKFFLPFVLETSNFLHLFIQIRSLLNLLLMPLVLIGCYLLHLFMIGLVTRIFWKFTEKMSPSKSGVIPRNVRSRTANYYHLRSFMIKYGKNSFTKGAFSSWLGNWFFNFVGTSKIGKGTTIEESLVNDKFLEIGSNCYFGVNSALTSHLVQGIFGNITYFKINIGNNVTGAARAGIAPGGEVGDNSYFLPIASTSKHSIIKGKNYYWGIPMRKIFRKKIMQYLGLTPKALEVNENIEGYKDKKLLKRLKAENFLNSNTESPIEENQIKEELDEEKIDINNLTEQDLALDVTTSSAISRVNIKFLAVYIPIFWLAGLIVSIFWYWYLLDENWVMILVFLPLTIIGSIYFFILACILFSKLFLILINLIHKPKEGVFKAEIGDKDFEFWMMRTELKKIALWFIRNSPLPWTDIVALILLGIDMDSSSHLNDAWCDTEFIKFGRKNLIGQGATIMSSMVIGKYLIIQKVICDDYIMVGGWGTIAPGTIVGTETVLGALSSTTVNQILEPGWVYFGYPAIKMKENKYAEERREVILKRDVDDAKKYEMDHELNIDEDKKKNNNSKKEVEKK